jgi:hypothetical protein
MHLRGCVGGDGRTWADIFGVVRWSTTENDNA